MSSTLDNIIKKLQQNTNVDAVFLTGSVGNKTNTKNSDIDLIVILKENNKNIQSVFTYIDNIFADIYFFDLDNIERLMELESLPDYFSEAKHSMNTLLYSWLKKGDILFDNSGKLTQLKSQEKDIKISDEKKYNSWIQLNYNYMANKRYFNSDDELYLQALEIRLMYSVPQVICAYYDFINKPWRGEKDIIKYLRENDLDFYNDFILFTQSNDLNNRFKYYELMVKKVFRLDERYTEWSNNLILPKSINSEFETDQGLVDYWRDMLK